MDSTKTQQLPNHNLTIENPPIKAPTPPAYPQANNPINIKRIEIRKNILLLQFAVNKICSNFDSSISDHVNLTDNKIQLHLSRFTRKSK